MNAAKRVDNIVQEVTIRGSAERIFEALTTPDQVLQWWRGEDKFKLTRMDVDLRIGGAWKMTGTRRDGRPLAVSGVYRRIERPRLLVIDSGQPRSTPESYQADVRGGPQHCARHG